MYYHGKCRLSDDCGGGYASFAGLDQDDEDVKSEGKVFAICLHKLRAEELIKNLSPCHHDRFRTRCIKE